MGMYSVTVNEPKVEHHEMPTAVHELITEAIYSLHNKPQGYWKRLADEMALDVSDADLDEIGTWLSEHVEIHSKTPKLVERNLDSPDFCFGVHKCYALAHMSISRLAQADMDIQWGRTHLLYSGLIPMEWSMPNMTFGEVALGTGWYD